VDHVAGVDEAKAHAAVNRRGDTRIDKLQFCIIDLGLVRAHRALKLSDLRILRVELLARDHAFLEKPLKAIEIGLGIRQCGLVFEQCGLRLA
jgi:hypothetical protein